MNRLAIVAALATAGLVSSSASALNVVLDYSNDTGYFNANPTAKATLQKAASDLSSFITTTLNATTDTNTGASGTSSVTFDHALAYTNPSTNAPVSLANAAVPANEFRVFVGRQNLTGATLAQGGPGGSDGFGVTGTQGTNFATAVNNAAAASTANLTRGGGPVIGTVNGAVGGVPVSVGYGALLGNLWFDSDTDNNGTADTDAQVNTYFQTDYTQPVGAGKVDLYSVALHEMLHSLGFGLSDTWDANIGGDGNDWLGANVAALLGSGNNNAVSSDGGHINGIYSSSTVYGTGIAQAPVMIPSIGTNQRRFLTTLDAAFIKDINYTIVAAPEPTTLAALSLVLVVARRRRAISC